MFGRFIVAAAGAGLTIALALSAGSATASSQAAVREPDPAVGKSIGKDAQDRAKKYWTESRMENARDGGLLIRDPEKSASKGSVARGEPTVVKGAAGKANQPKPRPQAFPGGYYTGGGTVVQTTGKVFFTLGGSDYVCSGSSTVAANRSLVQTAGHCLNEGPGSFATNFTFVPAYDDGSAPYGEFAATDLWTSTQWADQGDIDYDIGYAVVGTAGGSTLADAVGAQGVGFNLSRNATMYAFGYPAASPYDGSDIAWCNGPVAADTYGGTSAQGMVCNMTGGSSGGPWFVNYSEPTGLGTLNSLNSFTYNAGPLADRMFGPYFGSVVQGVYDEAQR